MTMDFDVVYAGAISAKNKKVILPDSRISKFKGILKNV